MQQLVIGDVFGDFVFELADMETSMVGQSSYFAGKKWWVFFPTTKGLF
jgi:hypothetical protein